MQKLLRISIITLFLLTGCSSYSNSAPDSTSLGELSSQVANNEDTIASQEQELAQLREELRHDSANIEEEASQGQHLFIGARLGSPY